MRCAVSHQPHYHDRREQSDDAQLDLRDASHQKLFTCLAVKAFLWKDKNTGGPGHKIPVPVTILFRSIAGS